MLDKRYLLSTVAALFVAMPVFAAGPSFHPDVTLTGSSLTGWHTVGQATWRAANGELTATPQSGNGGWLMLDKGLQDVGLYTEFRCAGPCDAGALFRAEKTADGWKGIYISFTDPDNGSYAVTLDAQGKILTREQLRRGGGLIRVAPAATTQAAGGPPRRPGGAGFPPRVAVDLPLKAPDTSMHVGQWNSIECMFDANIARAVLNNGREAGGVDDTDGYGPIALYVGGAGPVEFRNVGYTDLGLRVMPAEKTSPNFRKQQISDFYYSMTAAAADFNHDGNMDIVSGPYIYYGPDYTKRREIALAESTSPSTSFNEWWCEYTADFNGDGWPDIINVTYGGANAGVFLYVNPKGENRRWEKYKVVSNVSSEIAVLANVDGTGPAVVYMGGGYVSYAKPDPANPTGPWIEHHVSEAGYGGAHGIGVGDINGDGRLDVLNMYGWWEQPAAGGNGPWKYHSQAFGGVGHGISGGATMGVYDVNGDGLPDVVTSLNAHGWGLAWYEQKRDAQGNISFVQHMIMDDLNTEKENAGGVAFSELHAANFADMNGDGIPDLITGKRYWSHNADYLDPDPFGPPVLYIYKTVRDPKAPGGARFVPELVDNRSGVGSTVLPVDLKHDGTMDIVTGTKLGTFIFWGKPHAAAAKH
ncbi:MAG TPA: FG-GAP-like repeat-containing protein [Acidobacteriaceae bacterium]